MTDLNTRQYLYNQPYPLNQPGYGDNSSVNAQNGQRPAYGYSLPSVPTSLDDKRLDPVKDSLKTGNPVGKVVDGVTSTKKDETFKDKAISLVTALGLGTAATLGINHVLNNILIRGEDFQKSKLGQFVGKINNFSDKHTSLKFGWAENAWNGIKNRIGFIKQIADAPAAQPVWSMAKGMVTPAKNTILKEMLEEVGDIAKTKPEILPEVEKLKKLLENGTKNLDQKIYKEAYDLAHSLGSKNPTANFNVLKNKAQALMHHARNPISKFLLGAYNSVARIFHVGSFKGGLGSKGMAIGMFAMNAYFIGDMIKKTWDAPKGEKGSTFAHTLLVDFIGGWLLFEPLARGMYKGIGALRALEGKSIGKIITKPLNWLGNILHIGLGEKKAIPKAEKWTGSVANGFKHTGRFLVGLLGGVGRFGLMMMGLFPVMDKITRFVSHSVFGKPNALLAKEKAEEESGKSENPENVDKTEILNKALEQNRVGMLTVAAKNQASIVNNQTNQVDNNQAGQTNSMSPMVARALQSKLNQSGTNNNPAGASLKISDVKPELNKASDENKAISGASISGNEQGSHQYIPSDTRKNPIQDAEKKAKIEATLIATDRAIAEAEKTLRSD